LCCDIAAQVKPRRARHSISGTGYRRAPRHTPLAAPGLRESKIGTTERYNLPRRVIRKIQLARGANHADNRQQYIALKRGSKGNDLPAEQERQTAPKVIPIE